MENITNEIEVEGRTVEEAVKKAVSILKVPRKNLKIKVVAEEQKGLFGMGGAKPAKILAGVATKSSKKKA
ncbi:MAG: Jag N-terminal domain-containing protein [Candidatus Omnitrophica bacterium]|nr:Jag N-terminal domain-containing protein [Candidatus Omnitrophota bacterium]MDD5573704.1 Jag N-terminal domain-containing protein [Candidatus Omnitrophota bacterium]